MTARPPRKSRKAASLREELCREQFTGWDMLGVAFGGAVAAVVAILIGGALL